jgi:K+/H+ antiporter YhaU regulatory subunit KhtT
MKSFVKISGEPLQACLCDLDLGSLKIHLCLTANTFERIMNLLHAVARLARASIMAPKPRLPHQLGKVHILENGEARAQAFILGKTRYAPRRTYRAEADKDLLHIQTASSLEEMLELMTDLNRNTTPIGRRLYQKTTVASLL